MTARVHSFGRNSCDIGPFNHTMRIYSHSLIFSGTHLNLVGILKPHVLCHHFALLKSSPPDLVGTKTSWVLVLSPVVLALGKVEFLTKERLERGPPLSWWPSDTWEHLVVKAALGAWVPLEELTI